MKIDFVRTLLQDPKDNMVKAPEDVQIEVPMVCYSNGVTY